MSKENVIILDVQRILGCECGCRKWEVRLNEESQVDRFICTECETEITFEDEESEVGSE